MSQRVPSWHIDGTPAATVRSTKAADIPTLDYEVAELTWENGQLGLHGLGPPRVPAPSKYSTGAGGTLESIVDQATRFPNPKPTDELVPWFDHRSSRAAMDALVPEQQSQHLGSCSDGHHMAGEKRARVAPPEWSASGSQRLTMDTYGFTSTSLDDNSSSDGKPCTKTTTIDDHDSVCHSRPQFSGWGVTLPLKKLQEKGFLEKNKLIVKLQVKVVEVVDEGEVTGNEMLDVNGFQVLYSQVVSVTNLFTKHPDIAQYFRPRSQLVKTAYMNLLLRLIETLNKPPLSISDTELSNACSELIELTETGFKLDWLIKKLGLVSLERKKDNADVSPVQELEELIKNLKVELNKEKVKYATSAEKVLWLENTIWTLRRELIDDKAKSAAKGLLEGVVHSWNEWKVRLGFADLHYDKTD